MGSLITYATNNGTVSTAVLSHGFGRSWSHLWSHEVDDDCCRFGMRFIHRFFQSHEFCVILPVLCSVSP